MQEKDGSNAHFPAPSSDSSATSANSTTSAFSLEDVNRIRALRARRIEEIAYKLTDLVTVICAAHLSKGVARDPRYRKEWRCLQPAVAPGRRGLPQGNWRQPPCIWKRRELILNASRVLTRHHSNRGEIVFDQTTFADFFSGVSGARAKSRGFQGGWCSFRI